MYYFMQRVKKNREKRLRAGRGRGDTVTCPICNFRLSASTAEAHVDACLKKFTGKDEEDEESIDVEVFRPFLYRNLCNRRRYNLYLLI